MELVSLKNWPNKDDIVGYLQYVDEYVSELERNLEQADESKNNDEEKARLSLWRMRISWRRGLRSSPSRRERSCRI